MRILVKDKNYWLRLFQEKIDEIHRVRQYEDTLYEEKWRKRFLLPNRKPSEFPRQSGDLLDPYPSKTGWATLPYLYKMIDRLQRHEGEMWLDEDELELLEWGR